MTLLSPSAAILLVVGFMSLDGCTVSTDTFLDDYEPCSRNLDCDSGRCMTVDGVGATDRFCSRICESDAECQPTEAGAPGLCVIAEDGNGSCFETCSSDDECSYGWGCFDGLGGTYCQPTPV